MDRISVEHEGARNDARSMFESQVKAFYVERAESFLAEMSEPFMNLGYWSEGTTSNDEASRALVDRVLKALELGPGDRLLDVGCGFGSAALRASERSDCKEVVGVDIVPAMVDAAARSAAAADRGDRVRFEVMSAIRLDFEPGHFDRVMAIETAMHFDSRADFLKSACRVLRPGGRIVLADVAEGRPPRNPIDRLIVRALLRYWKIPPSNRYEVDGYEAVLEDCGFENVSIECIEDRVFPHLIRHILSPEIAAERRKKLAGPLYWLHNAVMRLVLRCHRKGGIRYLIVSAEKPSTSSEGAHDVL